MGWFATMALGIAGSVVGGFVASFIWGVSDAFQPGGFVLSLFGAILLLLFVRRVRTGIT
jgi:uncharacterized membrane protein YeaQ/YmgE (transglycosylase-associated protein family)